MSGLQRSKTKMIHRETYIKGNLLEELAPVVREAKKCHSLPAGE